MGRTCHISLFLSDGLVEGTIQSKRASSPGGPIKGRPCLEGAPLLGGPIDMNSDYVQGMTPSKGGVMSTGGPIEGTTPSKGG